METLNEYVADESVGAIGVSNWTWERIHDANTYAKANGLTGFAFSSPILSLAKPNEPFWEGCVSADAEMIAWHEAEQLPLLSWSSQARGFFTCRFSPEIRDHADLVRVFYSDDNWERLERAKRLAETKNVTAIHRTCLRVKPTLPYLCADWCSISRRVTILRCGSPYPADQGRNRLVRLENGPTAITHIDIRSLLPSPNKEPATGLQVLHILTTTIS